MSEFPSIYKQLFEELKINLQNNEFSPLLSKKAPRDLASSKFPLVVFVEADNYFGSENMCHSDQTYKCVFDIDIYTQDKTYVGQKYSDQFIAESIRDDIEYIFNGEQTRLKRNFCRPIPNVDKDIYRIRMEYRCTYRPDTNTFYRW